MAWFRQIAAPFRSPTWGWILVATVGALLGILITLLFLVPELPQEEQARWIAIGTALTGITTGISLAGLLALLIGVRSIQQASESQRLSHWPYLMVHVGFTCDDLRPPGFTLPDDSRVLQFSRDGAFSPEVRGILDQIHSSDEGAHPLMLWIENTQSAPLGMAIDIHVTLALWWATQSGAQDQLDVLCRVSCIAGSGAVQIPLCNVGNVPADIQATVTEVNYRNVANDAMNESVGYGSLVYRATGSEPIVVTGLVHLPPGRSNDVP